MHDGGHGGVCVVLAQEGSCQADSLIARRHGGTDSTHGTCSDMLATFPTKHITIHLNHNIEGSMPENNARDDNCVRTALMLIEKWPGFKVPQAMLLAGFWPW